MCVLLDSIDAKCVERTEFKRVDPVTGKCVHKIYGYALGIRYNLKYNSPKETTIVSRLVQEPINNKKIILKR